MAEFSGKEEMDKLIEQHGVRKGAAIYYKRRKKTDMNVKNTILTIGFLLLAKMILSTYWFGWYESIAIVAGVFLLVKGTKQIYDTHKEATQ